MDLSKSLHPRIYAALDAWEQQFYSDANKSSLFNEVANRHQGIWFKIYGARFLLRGAAAGLVAGGALGALSWSLFGPAAGQATMVGAGMAGLLTEWFLFYQRNRRSVTPEELRNLLPTLALSAVDKVYCEAILSLAENSQISELNKQEIATQFNGLLDAQTRLEEQRTAIMEALGNIEKREELEAERDSIQAKLNAPDAAADSITFNALQQSLTLCQERMKNRLTLEPSLGRIDAQSEFIRQGMYSLRESLARLKAAPMPLASSMVEGDTNMETIKRNIDGITTQTRSVEQAVQEVLSLRGS